MSFIDIKDNNFLKSVKKEIELIGIRFGGKNMNI